MQGVNRTLVVPPITLAEHDRRKAAGEYSPDPDREVEVLLTQADAGKLLALVELARLAKEVGLKAELPSEAAELALRLAIYRAAN